VQQDRSVKILGLKKHEFFRHCQGLVLETARPSSLANGGLFDGDLPGCKVKKSL